MACAGTPDQARQQFAARFAGVLRLHAPLLPSFGLTPERFQENLDAIIETFAAD